MLQEITVMTSQAQIFQKKFIDLSKTLQAQAQQEDSLKTKFILLDPLSVN
jgi:hypothetical protein